MLSYEINQTRLISLKKQITPNVTGLLWYAQDIENNLQFVKNLDYFFNGLIFKNIKSDKHKMNTLLITFARNFGNPLFLVYSSELKKDFEKIRSLLKDFDHELFEKKILLIGDFKTYKEKLELSFEKTKFTRLKLNK